MKKQKVVLSGLVVLLSICVAVQAEDKVEFGVTADFFSKYVWRGQNLVDDWVMQPGISATYGGLTGSIWANMDMTGAAVDSGEFNEVDYTLDYSAAFPGVDWLGFSVGVIYYDFPNTTAEGTTEIYGGLSIDTVASPSVTVYRDVDEAEGTYVSLGFGHSIEKTDAMPFGIDLGASIGWGDKDYNTFYWGGLDKSELNDLHLSLGLPFEVGSLSVTPSVHYVRLLGSGVRDSDAYSTDDDIIYGGVGLALSF